jgi:LPS export ABC transporter protein LptC/lipopolysaccharide transport protein LptA
VKRRSRLEWILLTAAAALAIAIVATFRRVPRPHRESAPPSVSVAPPRDAGKPTAVLSGFDFSQTTAGRTTFRIHADRTVGFAPRAGLASTWYGLENVTLTLYPERESPLTVHSQRADYDPRSNAMHLAGGVSVEDSNGTQVTTDRIEFEPKRRLLELPTAVAFRRGGLSGSAPSGTYEVDSHELTLAGPVHFSGVRGAGNPFETLAADAASYRRKDRRLVLSGNVRGTRGDNSFAADGLSLEFGPAQKKVDRAAARGRVTGVVAAPAAPGRPATRQLFDAETADLSFDSGGRLSGAVLGGSPARVRAAGAVGGASRTVAAPLIDLFFRDGALRQARAEGGVTIQSGPAGSVAPQTASARRARAEYSAQGEVERIELSGDAAGTSSSGRFRAARAELFPAEDRAILRGEGPQDAELENSRGRILARRIDVDRRRSVVVAAGEARADLAGGAANPSLPPYLVSSGRPTRARAQQIRLDDARRLAVLSGEAALWQGDSALFADRIELSDAARTLEASGQVRVCGLAAGPDESQRVSVSSARMRYVEADSQAIFEGGVVARRGRARAEGDEGRAHFGKDRKIDRMMLQGGVTYDDPTTGRSGSGRRVVDDPAAGVTVLSGDPAVAREGTGNRVTGGTLTFRKASGSVQIEPDGQEKVETIYQTHG